MKMSKEKEPSSELIASANNSTTLPPLNHETSINIPPLGYQPAFPMIPAKMVTMSTAMAQVITTTKTLRRFCGFVLALSGFLFYCFRAIGLIAWLGIKHYRADGSDSGSDLLVGGLEFVACGLGIGLFIRIMKYPRLTLESHNNFKNVFWFFLIPLASFIKIFPSASPSSSSPSLLIPAFEILFYSGYVYGLSFDGRSSSLWAGFKPYKYEMVPLILPVPPSSRAFPQYTVPPPLTRIRFIRFQLGLVLSSFLIGQLVHSAFSFHPAFSAIKEDRNSLQSAKSNKPTYKLNSTMNYKDLLLATLLGVLFLIPGTWAADANGDGIPDDQEQQGGNDQQE